MDGCGIFVLIFVIGLLIGTPFVLQAKTAHEEKLRELRESYTAAKQSGNPQKIISAGRAIVEEMKLRNPLGLPAASEEIYRDMLRLLKTSAEYKPFALEMGRLAYGSKRKDRNPTVYDEQAILNDINAHL